MVDKPTHNLNHTLKLTEVMLKISSQFRTTRYIPTNCPIMFEFESLDIQPVMKTTDSYSHKLHLRTLLSLLLTCFSCVTHWRALMQTAIPLYLTISLIVLQAQWMLSDSITPLTKKVLKRHGTTQRRININRPCMDEKESDAPHSWRSSTQHGILPKWRPHDFLWVFNNEL